MPFIAGVLAGFLLLGGSAWGQAPPGRSVIELLVNGSIYENNLPADLSSPLDPWRPNRTGVRFLYAVDLWPGRAYTLGLVVPGATGELAVSFFDRFPLDPQASRARLPTRPVVRTRGNSERYLWRFSISPRSAGRRLYVLVELAPLAGRPRRRPHRIFVVSPAIKPSLSMGRGLTFLEGPSQFLLAAEEGAAALAPPAPNAPVQTVSPEPGEFQGNDSSVTESDWLPPLSLHDDQRPSAEESPGLRPASAGSARLPEGEK